MISSQFIGGIMSYNYEYKLTEEEYLEYLRYLVSFTKGTKIRNLWLRFSVPLLVIMTLYYFRQYLVSWYLVIGISISLIWFFNISTKIINNFLYKKIDKNFAQNFKVKDFKPVNVTINEDSIILDRKKIEYSLIHNIAPLNSSLAIFYDYDKAFIIPNRIIKENDQLSEVVEFIEEKIKKED